MRVTAQQLAELKVIDRIVAEPLGGAHRDPATAIAALKAALVEELDGCATMSGDELLQQRRTKFLSLGG
jgi:acetyl-CoA carboxylase carboxyl transferase subunit alpha